MLLLAQIRLPGSVLEWVMAGITFITFVILMAYLLAYTLRKVLGSKQEARDEFAPKTPAASDPSFAAASMQAVIKRLKDQEKELERLHRAEKERAQQTERLSEAVTRDMPTGLLLINAAGLINLANPAAKATLGIEALAYRRYAEALGADSPLSRLVTDCLASGGTYQREEIDHVTPAGAKRHLGVTISPVYGASSDTAGKINGAVCLLTDLTQMLELQNQVRLKESLAALGEMSAGIAHEFKNSLATISGYAQLIRGAPQGPDSADNAQRIIQQTQALSHVVTEFLRFSRPLDVSIGDVDLGSLLARVREDAETAQPAVKFACSGEFAVCPGDEGLLRQAFLNLARNAGEALLGSTKPGEVQIHGEIADFPTPRQQVCFRDNGPGIPPEDLPKLFVPFYTTKPDGTGLGLALVQKIVVHHGGSVTVRNRPEGGAEFIVWLPLRPTTTKAIE